MTNNNVEQLYALWKKQNLADSELTADVKAISENEKEIFDCFYRNLEFGTAGLRGVLGAGTNRMNIYTVGQATQGYSKFLLENYKNPSVAIGYDSRKNSDVFARHSASIFAGNGIKVYIYKTLLPTPTLSFAIRELKLSGGVMITASHNPAKYNGYKVFGDDGCQIGPEVADGVAKFMQETDMFNEVKFIDFNDGLKSGIISYVGDEVMEKFYSLALNERIFPDAIKNTSLKIAYTPLNGTGNIPVRTVLERSGYKDVVIVKEQELPDSNFTTCPFPNPELKEALSLGVQYAKNNNCDLLIATDPDCDRVGIAVKSGDEYVLLTGNEVGVMLLEYICRGKIEKGNFPKNPVAVKTIVSTPLTEKICEKYGIDLKNVLTGFKFIGNEITKLEKANAEDNYLLGYEESYGYLKGIYVRDKDAVSASLMIAEMAAYYKARGKSLDTVRKEMYEEYGYFINNTENYYFEGASGMGKMAEIMDKVRESRLKSACENKLLKFADYRESYCEDIATGKRSVIDLPSSNVLSFMFDDDFTLIVRPSGTEPKIKLYYTTKGKTYAEGVEKYQKLTKIIKEYIGL